MSLVDHVTHGIVVPCRRRTLEVSEVGAQLDEKGAATAFAHSQIALQVVHSYIHRNNEMSTSYIRVTTHNILAGKVMQSYLVHFNNFSRYPERQSSST